MSKKQAPSILLSGKNKKGAEEVIPYTTIIADYNNHMGYVNKANMLKKSTTANQSSGLQIFSVVNFFILFKERSIAASAINLETYCLAIVNGIVGSGSRTEQ